MSAVIAHSERMAGLVAQFQERALSTSVYVPMLEEHAQFTREPRQSAEFYSASKLTRLPKTPGSLKYCDPS